MLEHHVINWETDSGDVYVTDEKSDGTMIFIKNEQVIAVGEWSGAGFLTADIRQPVEALNMMSELMTMISTDVLTGVTITDSETRA